MRCLLKPRVQPSSDPCMVMVKTPTEAVEMFFETKLTPDEAEELGLALILDAKRAKRHLETERWLRDRR